MKKHIEALIFGASLLMVSVCDAQPTLTSAGMTILVGEHFTENFGNYVSAGNAGANQTWDLSSISADTSATYDAVSPSSTPYSSSFPNANMSLDYNGSYAYYKFSSSSWQNYGGATSSAVISYSTPETLLEFPFTYNNSFTSPWAVSFNSAGYEYYRSGTTAVTADGYGTLKTPAGTTSNVLRVHFVQNYTDSVNIESMWFVTTYNNNQYIWYLNGSHYPLASVYTLTEEELGVTDSAQAGEYLGNVSGIDEEAGALGSYTVFPNPVSDNLNLDVNLSSNQKVEVQLFNAMGAEVNTAELHDGSQGDNKYVIDVHHLPQGIYLARIMLNDVLSSTKQFIISR